MEVDGLGGRRDGGEGRGKAGRGGGEAGGACAKPGSKERSGAMPTEAPLPASPPSLHRPALGSGSRRPFWLGAAWTEADERMAWTQTRLPGGGGGQRGSEAGDGRRQATPKAGLGGGEWAEPETQRSGLTRRGSRQGRLWAPHAAPRPRGPLSASVAHSPRPRAGLPPGSS